MEVARLGMLRGHRITLVEADDRLGGRFALAAATAEPNAELLAWLEGEMARREVDVRLGTRLDAAAIAAGDWDEVVVATGGRWDAPAIPGIEDERVSTVDALRDWLGSGGSGSEQGRRFVLIGGDRAGVALAGVARARGAEVEVLEGSTVFAASNGLVGRWRYVHDALESGVRLEPGVKVHAIEPGGVRWSDAEGADRLSRADRILISGGAVPDASLVGALAARGVRAHAVGDCERVGLVEGAMAGAADLMLAL
jgi:2,4-dienoyl-CoA reductase (NADPH2)